MSTPTRSFPVGVCCRSGIHQRPRLRGLGGRVRTDVQVNRCRLLAAPRPSKPALRGAAKRRSSVEKNDAKKERRRGRKLRPAPSSGANSRRTQRPASRFTPAGLVPPPLDCRGASLPRLMTRTPHSRARSRLSSKTSGSAAVGSPVRFHGSTNRPGTRSDHTPPRPLHVCGRPWTVAVEGWQKWGTAAGTTAEFPQRLPAVVVKLVRRIGFGKVKTGRRGGVGNATSGFVHSMGHS